MLDDEALHEDHTAYRDRLGDVGAVPQFGVANRDGSIMLMHADFDGYEGVFDKFPFLILHLCTAHVGRLYRQNTDGSVLEGLIRPGSFGVTLPHTQAEGYWPRTKALNIMINEKHLSEIGDESVSLEKIASAAGSLHRDPLVSSVMTAIWRDAEAHGLTSAFFDHGLELILKRICSLEQNARHASGRPARPLSKIALARALELIESKVSSDVKVSELAYECGQDVRSFTRSFRASTGYAPYEYLTLRRMETARRLLLSGTSVTEAAVFVGYANPSKFAAAFRRFYGSSPSQLRNELRAPVKGSPQAS